MHYWQHNALPDDEARLAAIAGLSVVQWRRIRGAIEAKFGEGWTHKRIDAEIAKVDRAYMQRRMAGRNGGIKSGIARAVAQGEAILQAQAKEKRALARRSSAGQTAAPAAGEQPATNHNHRFESSLIGSADTAPKPASKWSRQELDALFAKRNGAESTERPETDEDTKTGE
jgi:uncharacterized protein YdaU (DUF1376 family)